MSQREEHNRKGLPYYKSPAVSPDGRQIAFVYQGDIWLVSSEGGEARRVVAHSAYDERPRFSPDGRYLAFTSYRTGGGDVYLLDLTKGELSRLTYHDSADYMETWSPDGEWIYFTSPRDLQGLAVYKVHRNGGASLRVMGEPYESFYNLSISPDGRRMAFNNNGDPWWRKGPNPNGASDIWIVQGFSEDTSGEGEEGFLHFEKVPTERCRNMWPLWDAKGEGFYFVSDRDGVENLWYQPLEGPAQKVTFFTEGRVLRPAISANGEVIIFERDFELWRCDLKRGEVGPLAIQAISDEHIEPVHSLSSGEVDTFELSPDGKKVLLEVRGNLFADFAEKEEGSSNTAFPLCVTDAREGMATWSPDSKKVAYISDRTGVPQIYLYDFITHQETQITSGDAPKYHPLFSPDGQWIAYFQRPDEIRLYHLETQEDKPFVRAAFYFGVPGPASYAWSPDSQWLAFVRQDEQFFSNVYVQHINEQEAKPLSFLSNIDCGNILWAPNGKFIIFTTVHHRWEHQIARIDLVPPPPQFKESEFEKLFEKKKDKKDQQKPSEPSSEAPSDKPEEKAEEKAPEDKKGESVQIIFEGIKNRLTLLTPPTLNAWAVQISPDSKYLVFRTAITGRDNFWYLPLEEEKAGEPAQQLTATKTEKGPAFFTPDGKRLYYLNGGRIYYRDFPKGEPKTLEVRTEYNVHFHQEKLQIFEEAWSLLRDHFYDPNFHGVNWNKVREIFLPRIQGVRCREDLYELLNLMVGELNASHLGCFPPGSEPQTGYLGLEFDAREIERFGRYRITQVLPDGPATRVENPPKPGEYVLAVNGTPLSRSTALEDLLHRSIGKRVILTVSDQPSEEGAREVAIRPINAGQADFLAYRAWVQDNARYVEELSKGRLGYIHIRAMSWECYQRFIQDLDAEMYRKEGVVIDVRFNPGGYVAPFILDVLYRRSWDRSIYRRQVSAPGAILAGNRVWEKPTILITNEHSGSNTEMFSLGYRSLGLGKVVGKPTAGAVIWTWGWRFVDGAWFRLPRLEVSTPEGENLEGSPRPVDYEVDRSLGEALQGRDSQLATAVRLLLEQIEAQSSTE